MDESDIQSLRQERERWYQRACEFRALALAARRDEDDDDAAWFERAYRQALEKHTALTRLLEDSTAAVSLAA